MFMDHTYTQTEVENYKLQVELLQEKLKRCEEHRHQLEHKLEQILKKRSEHDERMRIKAREKYQQFVEEQEKRNKRNKQLMQMLERIDEQSATLSARSERLKMMKLQHEMYFAKLFKAQTMRCMQRDTTPTTSSTPVIRLTDLLQPTGEGVEAAPISTTLQPSTVSLLPVSPTISPAAKPTMALANAAIRSPLLGCQNLESNLSPRVPPTRDSFGSLLKSHDNNTGGTVVDDVMTVAQLASPYWTFALAMPTSAGLLFTNTPSTSLPAQTQMVSGVKQSAAPSASVQATKAYRNLNDYRYQTLHPILDYAPMFSSEGANNSLAQENEKMYGIRAEGQDAMREMLGQTNTALDSVDILSKQRGIRKGKDSNETIRIKDEHNVNTNDNCIIHNETNNNNETNNSAVRNEKEFISPMPSEKHDDIKAETIIRTRKIPAGDNNEIYNRDDSNNNDLNNNNNYNNNNNNNNNDYNVNDNEGSRNVNLNALRKWAVSQGNVITPPPSSFKTTSVSPLTRSSVSCLSIPSSLTFNKLKILDENVNVLQQNRGNEYGGDGGATTAATNTRLGNMHSAEAIVEPTQTADSGNTDKCIRDEKSVNFVESNLADQDKNHTEGEILSAASETNEGNTGYPISSVSRINDRDKDYGRDGGRDCHGRDDIPVANNVNNYKSRKIDELKALPSESNATTLATATTTTTTMISTTLVSSISQSFPHFERKEKMAIENIENVFYGEFHQASDAAKTSSKESRNRDTLMPTGDIIGIKEELADNAHKDNQLALGKTDELPPAVTDLSEQKQATKDYDEEGKEETETKEVIYEDDSNAAVALESDNTEYKYDEQRAREDTSQYQYHQEGEEGNTVTQEHQNYDENYDSQNYDAATYQTDIYDINEYPGYSYDESSGQYVSNDANQQLFQTQENYLEDDGQYDKEQHEQDQLHHLDEGASEEFQQTFESQKQTVVDAYDELATVGGSTAESFETAEMKILPEENVEVRPNADSPACASQPLETVSTLKKSKVLTLKGAASPSASSSSFSPSQPAPSQITNATIKPILNVERLTAANDAQQNKKKKKRVNFVDSSETDDSSSVKPEGVAGSATESDFDF